MLQSFVANWNRTRPPKTGQFSASAQLDVRCMGAVEWIVEESQRLDPSGPGLPRGTVQGVIGKRTDTTELRIADPLLTIIGREDAFHNGTLTVRPNMNAPKDVRQRCKCGGSTARVYEPIGRIPRIRA